MSQADGAAVAVQAIHLRRACEADAHALYLAERATSKVAGQSWYLPYELSEELIRQRIAGQSKAGIFLLAEIRGTLAGHACLTPQPLSQLSHVYTLTMVVHAGHTGRGVATRLMNALTGWAAQQTRVEKIELRVRQNNLGARKLCARFGFVEEGRFERCLKLADGSYLGDIAMARFF